MMRFLFFVMLFAVAVPLAAAQSFGGVDELDTNTAYFVHTRPGEATIQVYVVGDVGLPGLYEIAAGTRVDRLLALAGGPPSTSQERGRRRSVAVRLYRAQGEGRALTYEAPLDELLTRRGPVLAGDDVVQIETTVRQRFGWRDGLSLVTAIAALVLTVDRIAQ